MKIDRMMSIILILLEKRRISAKDLADKFEVSLRTIYRDIDAIDLAGIPIRAISGVGGGFEIMPNYKIDKQVFSQTDITTIMMGLLSVSNVVKKDEMINVFTKVKSLIPFDKEKELLLKVNQIQIDLNHWMGNENIQPYIERCKVALQESKLISFSYIAHRGKQSERLIEPYQLVVKGSHWYVYGYCYNRDNFRLFRLSRMTNLKVMDKVFLMRDCPKLQLDFTSELATMQTRIKIRIHKSILDRVLDYCSYENFSLDEQGYYIVSFPFVDNDYYYDVLLSFGDKCECLEPMVREKMKQKIFGLLSVYQSEIEQSEFS